jgi:hypothetical protein
MADIEKRALREKEGTENEIMRNDKESDTKSIKIKKGTKGTKGKKDKKDTSKI